MQGSQLVTHCVGNLLPPVPHVHKGQSGEPVVILPTVDVLDLRAIAFRHNLKAALRRNVIQLLKRKPHVRKGCLSQPVEMSPLSIQPSNPL